MWKLVIGFVIGFAVASYGVQNTIDKAEGLVDSSKEIIEKYTDDADGQNSN